MDPAKMKVVDLRSELAARGLDTKGNKPALVERLKKALESSSGEEIQDTTIADTSTEDVDVPETPARRTRRQSSTAKTPAKMPSFGDPPDSVMEDQEAEIVPKKEPEVEETPVIVEAPKVVETPKAVEQPKPVPRPEPVVAGPEPDNSDGQAMYDPDVKCLEDDSSRSPIPVDDLPERQSAPVAQPPSADGVKSRAEQPEAEGSSEAMDQDAVVEIKEEPKEERPARPLTEEEEWEAMNERLRQKEEERKERERLQAEEDARKLEEASQNPIKLNRLKRKQEKKARWSNFYRSVEITNEVLAPPDESRLLKGKKNKKEQVEESKKIPEPELDEDKVTLSWYDSDLHQYLELPALNTCVALSEGAFANAWAGVRATHGVTAGRVCYEVRVGAVVSTTEESASHGLRIGWSTEDSSLHLGDGPTSWALESSGRALNNCEFKEYGKTLTEKDVVGAYIDLESSPCKILYTINGVEQGAAFEFDKATLQGRPLFPHLCVKNMCYSVNFGYDRYNMLTKTKIARNRIDVPIEQVLEEKRVKEEAIKKIKEEQQRIAREKREKEKLERELRAKKKKEEREARDKAERERKEREAKERGEEMETDADKDGEGEKDKEGDKEDGNKDSEPKENGDKNKETEAGSERPAEDKAGEVKEETQPDGDHPAEVTEEQVYKGHVLDKRIKTVIRYEVTQELDGEEALLLPGYLFIADVNVVAGPRRPATNADCEVILMVGLPGCGKTFWAKRHMAACPEKRYNLLSTGALFERMKVDCKPFRESYEGRWEAFVTKCAKCVLKLLEIAQGRRRNFILDQTNVYPSAQRRKLREFEGYRRVAVVIVPALETYEERQKRREETDGKEVPDGAILDMKANFTLPEKGPWLDDVIFAELGEEEAKAIIEGYHQEAKAAGVSREKEKRERSASRDEPPSKRNRQDDRRRDDRRGSRGFDDRRGGGGGGGRWMRDGSSGGGGGGGNRWGPPVNSGSRDRPSRDRWGSGNGSDMGRGYGGGGGGGRDFRSGNRNDRPSGGGGGNDRFSRDRRPNDRAPNNNQGSWQRGSNMGGGRGGGGAGGMPMGTMGRGGGQMNRKDGPAGMNANPQNPPNQNWNQQQWNQWGNWANWNQQNPQAWNQWNNQWANWNASQQGQPGQVPQQGKGNQAGGTGTGPAAAAAAGGQQNQWGNYTAQQWYQWQQWQQQQQGWPGYGQQPATGAAAAGAGAQATPTQEQQQQMWAQYYQTYGGANAAAAGNATGITNDKK